jgi:hypothetical protein
MPPRTDATINDTITGNMAPLGVAVALWPGWLPACWSDIG